VADQVDHSTIRTDQDTQRLFHLSSPASACAETEPSYSDDGKRTEEPISPADLGYRYVDAG
jgi:hypothetical protein